MVASVTEQMILLMAHGLLPRSAVLAPSRQVFRYLPNGNGKMA